MEAFDSKPRSLFALAMMVLVVSTARGETGELTSHGLDDVVALRQDTRSIEVTGELRQNPDQNVRLIVPDKCEKEGVLELWRMAASDPLEESYVYAPARCLWVEVGHSETATRVRLDSALVAALAQEFPSLTVYHTHVAVPADAAGYFPAYTDLVSVPLMVSSLLDGAGSTIAHRAVTPIGIIEYAFLPTAETLALINKLNRKGLQEFVPQNLAYTYGGRGFRERYNALVSACRERAARDSANFADYFPMKSDAFVLRFVEAPMEALNAYGE